MILTALDWAIWFIFLLEFALKIYVEGDTTTYIRNNKLAAAISLIIVASPVAAVISDNPIPFPVFGIARALRIFRILGYGDSAHVKNKQKKIEKQGNKYDPPFDAKV